jgi:GntR family transcriptional regulator, transcriptional repressor for pyruvate dehydrogenase complex
MTRQLQALIESAGPGSSGRLPSERQLAQRFQCSRNTVREALAALTAQGLIGIRGRVGAYRLSSPVADATVAAADLEQALGALHVTIPAL